MSNCVTVWLAGLSGVIKSTIAKGLKGVIDDKGRLVDILDSAVVHQHHGKGRIFERGTPIGAALLSAVVEDHRARFGYRC